MQKPKLPALIEFEFPDISLSIGDIVSRAARFVRTNYKLVYRLYLVPTSIYVICWELMLWLAEHAWMPMHTKVSNSAFDISLAGIVVCFLLIWFCVWWLRTQALTLWLLMSGAETSLESAVKRSRDFRMLWIYFPTLIIELVEAAWSTVLMIFISQAEASKSTTQVLQAAGLYFALLIVWTVPFRMLAILNLFPAYNLLVTESSIGKGFKKFFFYCQNAPLTIFYATAATAIVVNCLELPITIPTAIGGAFQASGLDQAMIEWFTLVPRLVMEIAIGAVSTAMCTVIAVLLDNELQVRLQGRDVVDRLTKFQSKQG
jgi:hypothetical protein